MDKNNYGGDKDPFKCTITKFDNTTTCIYDEKWAILRTYKLLKNKEQLWKIHAKFLF